MQPFFVCARQESTNFSGEFKFEKMSRKLVKGMGLTNFSRFKALWPRKYGRLYNSAVHDFAYYLVLRNRAEIPAVN